MRMMTICKDPLIQRKVYEHQDDVTPYKNGEKVPFCTKAVEQEDGTFLCHQLHNDDVAAVITRNGKWTGVLSRVVKGCEIKQN